MSRPLTPAALSHEELLLIEPYRTPSRAKEHEDEPNAFAEAHPNASNPFAQPSTPHGTLNQTREMVAVAGARRAFKKRFRALAEHPNQFHALIRDAYGPDIRTRAVEALRARVQNGDFTWLPTVRFADPRAFSRGGLGAYDTDRRTIFLSRALVVDPVKTANVYAEEVGHHLDQWLNPRDAPGDEGALFERLLRGQPPSARERAALRRENDRATLRIDGNAVSVELSSPVSDLGQGLRRAGESFVDGLRHVIGGLIDALVGFFGHLFEGRVEQAFTALWKGFDRAVFQSNRALVESVVEATTGLVKNAVRLLPVVGPHLGAFCDRVHQAVRGGVLGGVDALRGMARNVFESSGQFVRGLGRVATGQFREGLRDLGVAPLRLLLQTPADAVLMAGGNAISALQTVTGLEPAGRSLTDRETRLLRKIYGDSIDYPKVEIVEGGAGVFSINPRPFALGNRIYLKDRTQNDAVVIHEMAHVWQFQNGGTNYMSESLVSQVMGKGYDWSLSVPETPWKALEPEQQAQLLEDAARAGFFDTGTFSPHPPAVVDYLKKAMVEVRAGRGAP